MTRAYVALGSNLGERERQLGEALRRLHAHPEVEVKAVSTVYETDPVGLVVQPPFLNLVAAVETTLPAPQLLAEALRIEACMGRIRTVRWGPRIIDIDILLYGEERIVSPSLTIPHPAMTERAFVLVPLRDVWLGDWSRLFDKPLDEYIAQAADRKGVRAWGTLDWETGFGPSAS